MQTSGGYQVQSWAQCHSGPTVVDGKEVLFEKYAARGRSGKTLWTVVITLYFTLNVMVSSRSADVIGD